MLRGEMTGLRARHDSDIPVLHAGLYDDVATRVRADSRPWQPIPPGSGSPYAVTGPDDHAACFSAVELATGALAGEALLWNIDPHNRAAHIGISLLPAFRGRGLGTDVVRVLCHYGFAIRGLHRLQIETLADNNAMIQAASRAGFAREGTLRGSTWVNGDFANEVILGLLTTEWKAS
jgi:RimJ/RimL family protein N-acetyltransferase